MGFYLKFSFLIYRRGNKEIEKNLIIYLVLEYKDDDYIHTISRDHILEPNKSIMKVVDTLKPGNICQTK